MKKIGMHSFSYGRYRLGWIPGNNEGGGFYRFFNSEEEYRETFNRETVNAKRKNLDALLKTAGINGGVSRADWHTRHGR